MLQIIHTLWSTREKMNIKLPKILLEWKETTHLVFQGYKLIKFSFILLSAQSSPWLFTPNHLIFDQCFCFLTTKKYASRLSFKSKPRNDFWKKLQQKKSIIHYIFIGMNVCASAILNLLDTNKITYKSLLE